MKEHKDDVLLGVKESTVDVDSTTSDEIVTERGKIEEILGEIHDGEDAMVDVVGADVAVDDHGVTRVDLGGKVGFIGEMEEGSERETRTRDQIMEDVGLAEHFSDDFVESKVVTLEKVEVVVSEEGVKGSVEVVKQVIQEKTVTTSGPDCDFQKSGNGPVVGDSEMASEMSSKEAEAGGGEIEVIDSKEVTNSVFTSSVVERPAESVEDIADGDHVVDPKAEQETVVSNSSKNPESAEGYVVAVKEGLAGKDKADDSISNQRSLTEVVNARTGEEDVHVSMKNTEQRSGVDQPGKEILQSTTEATTNDAQMSGNRTRVGDSKMAVESLNAEPQIALTEETVEWPTESAQEMANVDCVMNEKTGKDEVLDSTTITASVTKVVEVVVEEGLAGNDETQDGVTVDQSSLCPDNSNHMVNTGTGEAATVHENTEILGQKAQVDQTRKQEISQSTVDVITHNAPKSEDSKMNYESRSRDPQVLEGEIAVTDKKEPEIDLSKETMEQPTGPVQEIAYGDHLINEKTENEVLVSSKHLIMSSLGLEETDVVVVEEDLKGKDEAQISVSVELSLANPDNKSSSAEVGNAGTGEALTTEIDATSKDESSHATIEEVPSERCKTDVGAYGKPDEVTTAGKDPNSDSKDSTDGGISVENQSTEINAVTDSSKPDVVAYTEQKSSIHEMVPAISNKVVETDTGAQASRVEPLLIGSDSSNIQEDQGLNDNLSNDKSLLNRGNETTTLQLGPPGSTVEVLTEGEPQIYPEHGILPANSEFSYEGHMERGEDAGMDIDEVLGWKDEIPGADGSMQEIEQKVDPTNLSSIDENLNEEQETEVFEYTLEAKQWNETSVLLQQACYFHPPENEGDFSVSDLVWGKVRSHPWWPGQIFDPSDASEKAMKYHKKDCFLVAYFGDRTFAWNDSTVLKPFRPNFPQIEKNSSSESFSNAVHCALEEVSRRVELGLTCSCIPHEIYEKIKFQIVENSGIRQESSRRHGVDKSASVNSFEPDKLVDYVRLLARFPYGESDKMELAITKAQLSSYGRYKGYRQLAEFQFSGDVLEDASVLNDGVKQIVKDGQQISDKNEIENETCSKKRKALDSISDASEKRQSLHPETVPEAKQSYKVGACIQKVASQLSTDQAVGNDVSMQNPGNTSNQSDKAEMLLQLQLAAQDPMKGHDLLNTIIPFFYSHRAAVVSKSRQNSSSDARKRKSSNENDPEEFEFDDVNDSYWTDRVIQNYAEEQILQENQNGGGGEHQIVAYEQDKQQPVKPTRRSNKKRFFSSNHEIEAKEQSELIERRRQNLATEVLMKFAEGIYFPSEIHLNKMFKRFGPLMESETEVDRQSGRARVVFKKCSDAEVAHSSAGKFNIFGSTNVNYELNYTPLISYKPLPLPLAQDPAGGAC